MTNFSASENALLSFVKEILGVRKSKGKGHIPPPLRDITVRCEECGSVIKTSCISYSCSACRTVLLSDDYAPTKQAKIMSSQLKENY